MALESVTVALLSTLGGTTANVLYEAARKYLSEKVSDDDIKLLEEEDEARITSTESTNLEKVFQSFELTSGVHEATKGASSAISAALSTVQALREDRRKQAKWSFAAFLASGIVGTIIIFTGVALLVSGDDALVGGVTAGAGIVSEIVAGIFYKLYRDANDRFDVMMRDAQILESTQIGIETAAKIENNELRDQTLSELAKRVNTHK